MKTLVALSLFITSNAFADKCIWYSESQKPACYLEQAQEQAREQAFHDETNRYIQQVNNQIAIDRLSAQAADQAIMHPRQPLIPIQVIILGGQ